MVESGFFLGGGVVDPGGLVPPPGVPVACAWTVPMEIVTRIIPSSIMRSSLCIEHYLCTIIPMASHLLASIRDDPVTMVMVTLAACSRFQRRELPVKLLDLQIVVPAGITNLISHAALLWLRHDLRSKGLRLLGIPLPQPGGQ